MIIYYCLTLILLLPIILAVSSVPFRVQQFARPDLNNPRAQAELLTGVGERVVHAQKNAWEALVVFAVVLFIAYANNVDPQDIATACLVYVAARLLHAVFYLANLGILRFGAFMVGFVAAMSIVYKALF